MEDLTILGDCPAKIKVLSGSRRNSDSVPFTIDCRNSYCPINYGVLPPVGQDTSKMDKPQLERLARQQKGQFCYQANLNRVALITITNQSRS